MMVVRKKEILSLGYVDNLNLLVKEKEKMVKIMKGLRTYRRQNEISDKRREKQNCIIKKRRQLVR